MLKIDLNKIYKTSKTWYGRNNQQGNNLWQMFIHMYVNIKDQDTIIT